MSQTAHYYQYHIKDSIVDLSAADTHILEDVEGVVRGKPKHYLTFPFHT